MAYDRLIGFSQVEELTGVGRGGGGGGLGGRGGSNVEMRYDMKAAPGEHLFFY